MGKITKFLRTEVTFGGFFNSAGRGSSFPELIFHQSTKGNIAHKFGLSRAGGKKVDFFTKFTSHNEKLFGHLFTFGQFLQGYFWGGQFIADIENVFIYFVFLKASNLKSTRYK